MNVVWMGFAGSLAAAAMLCMTGGEIVPVRCQRSP